jgi:ribosomal protein S12 methylthiotransferase accessory factor
LAGVIERVPITRVYDATALDHLGVPVWAAVTPLARDLTVHAGKGTTPQAARISAVMEAIERVSAESVSAERVRRASYLSMRGREPVVDPACLDLPFQTTYAPDRECSWVKGEDLLGGQAAWLPLDLIISPAHEGVAVGPETNGLAAGNVEVEAILHAAYEVVERDAVAHDRFAQVYGRPARRRMICLETLPEPAGALVARAGEAGIEVTVEDLTHDLSVPVFGAVLGDPGFPGREGTVTRFSGYGADLDGEVAVTRAVCEAVQSHTAVLVGAREAFEEGFDPPMSVGRWIARLSAGADQLAFAAPGSSELPDDLGERLELVLGRLASAGLAHCFVVDLTRADLDVPVVRVLVPGLSGPLGHSARRPGLRLLRTLL